MFDDTVLANFKQRLLERRRELLSLEESSADLSAVELDQSRVGRLSRMDALQDQAMSVEMKRRRKLALQGIDEALRRIEDNEYGICLNCGGVIAQGRLDLDPAIELCVDCAGEKEREST